MTRISVIPMELHRIGVKIGLDRDSKPDIRDFLPVFHGWIRDKAITDHLLIDVADYSHVYHGPGVVLVAHEANYSMDQARGRPGLFYQRKQPIDGGMGRRWRTILRAALLACKRLEAEPSLQGKVRFSPAELEFIANDRLLAPNHAETLKQIEASLDALFTELCGRGGFTIRAGDPGGKTRPSVMVACPDSPGIDTLLERTKP